MWTAGQGASVGKEEIRAPQALLAMVDAAVRGSAVRNRISRMVTRDSPVPEANLDKQAGAARAGNHAFSW